MPFFLIWALFKGRFILKQNCWAVSSPKKRTKHTLDYPWAFRGYSRNIKYFRSIFGSYVNFKICFLDLLTFKKWNINVTSQKFSLHCAKPHAFGTFCIDRSVNALPKWSIIYLSCPALPTLDSQAHSTYINLNRSPQKAVL